jgi:hypothetical protein
MSCYRVVILDENQKVLISKVVTADADTTEETIANSIRAVIKMHGAPFTVSVSKYASNCTSVSDFMAYLNTALGEMSLRGPQTDRVAMTEDWP